MLCQKWDVQTPLCEMTTIEVQPVSPSTPAEKASSSNESNLDVGARLIPGLYDALAAFSVSKSSRKHLLNAVIIHVTLMMGQLEHCSS